MDIRPANFGLGFQHNPGQMRLILTYKRGMTVSGMGATSEIGRGITKVITKH